MCPTFLIAVNTIQVKWAIGVEFADLNNNQKSQFHQLKKDIDCIIIVFPYWNQ